MEIKNNAVLKKLWAALPAVIGILLALVSMIATQKHVSETERYFAQYNAALETLTQYVGEIAKENGFNRIGYVISVRDNALSELDMIRESLDYFEKIKPPKSLRAEHTAILNSLAAERAFIDATEQVFLSYTAEQLKQNVSAVLTFADYETSADGFPSALSAFMKKLEKLKSSRSRYNRFVWI